MAAHTAATFTFAENSNREARPINPLRVRTFIIPSRDKGCREAAHPRLNPARRWICALTSWKGSRINIFAKAARKS